MHFVPCSAANLLTGWAVISEQNSCFTESFQLSDAWNDMKKMWFDVLGLDDSFCETVRGGEVDPLIMSRMRSVRVVLQMQKKSSWSADTPQKITGSIYYRTAKLTW